MKKYLYILLLTALSACQPEPVINPTVRECAPMPAGGRAGACVCTLDGKAYVFAGRDNTGSRTNSLWAYTASADSWTQLPDCPGSKRVNATMAACNGVVYMGLGYTGGGVYKDQSYLHDWWKYDPATAQWTQLADFPSNNTVAAVSYTTDGKIYVLYGFGHHYTREMWVYTPDDNQWRQIPDNTRRPIPHFGGRGALCQAKLYYGLGFNTQGNRTQWYEVDLATDTWVARRSIPGKGREFAASAASGEYVYILGGRHFGGDMTGGEIMNSYARYSPDKDTWEWCGTMPCGRAENLIAFAINGKVYFGLGENEKGQMINQLYCIE